MAKNMDNTFQRGKMRTEDEKCLTTYMKDILDIEPSHVIQYLHNDGILSSNDIQTIKKKRTRKNRVEGLVDVLKDRGPNSFDGFVRALLKGRYLELASKLKTMAEAIKYDRPQNPAPKKGPVAVAVVRPRQQVVPKFKLVTQQVQSEETSPKRPITITPVENTESHAAVGGQEQDVQSINERNQSVLSDDEDDKREPEEHEESEEPDRSTEVYETLNGTCSSLNTLAVRLSSILKTFVQDDEDTETTRMEEELGNRMQKVNVEKTRADKSSTQDRKVFNRDMVILVMEMRKTLTFLTDIVQKIEGSLNFSKSETETKRTINEMQQEIDSLKDQLEEKNRELAEIVRDHDAERQGLMADYKYAMKSVLEKESIQFKKEQKDMKERYLEEGLREKEEKRRAAERPERERFEKEWEKEKQRIEEQEREMARLKEEMEEMKRKQESTPRTRKTSLPVRGRAVQGHKRN